MNNQYGASSYSEGFGDPGGRMSQEEMSIFSVLPPEQAEVLWRIYSSMPQASLTNAQQSGYAPMAFTQSEMLNRETRPDVGGIGISNAMYSGGGGGGRMGLLDLIRSMTRGGR